MCQAKQDFESCSDDRQEKENSLSGSITELYEWGRKANSNARLTLTLWFSLISSKKSIRFVRRLRVMRLAENGRLALLVSLHSFLLNINSLWRGRAMKLLASTTTHHTASPNHLDWKWSALSWPFSQPHARRRVLIFSTTQSLCPF